MIKKGNYRPRVSFCISTYKRIGFLSTQLKAIQLQTIQDFEVIVCDNDFEMGSARKAVEEFDDPRFIYHTNEINLGMVKSFNRCLSLSSGEFIVMITDDDPVYPNMLEDLLTLADSHPDYGMYVGSHDIQYTKLSLAQISGLNPGLHSGLSQYEIGYIREVKAQQYLESFCSDDFGGGILWSAAIVRRSVAMKVGGVPDYGTPFMSDAAYLIICGSERGAVYLNKAVGCQTMHGDNFSYANTSYEYLELAPKAFYEFIRKQMGESINPELDKLLRQYIGKILTTYFISLHRILISLKAENKSFDQTMSRIYHWEVMKKWKYKFKIATKMPRLFRLCLEVKKLLKG